jgi:predicted transposase YdaD
MTGDNEYENIILTRERKVTNMCEIAQRLINQGREEGRILGLKDGRSTGLIEGTVIAFAGLVRDGRLTIAEAAQRAGMSEDTFKENMKKFNV